jgi:hypothetical protein
LADLADLVREIITDAPTAFDAGMRESARRISRDAYRLDQEVREQDDIATDVPTASDGSAERSPPDRRSTAGRLTEQMRSEGNRIHSAFEQGWAHRRLQFWSSRHFWLDSSVVGDAPEEDEVTKLLERPDKPVNYTPIMRLVRVPGTETVLRYDWIDVLSISGPSGYWFAVTEYGPVTIDDEHIAPELLARDPAYKLAEEGE